MKDKVEEVETRAAKEAEELSAQHETLMDKLNKNFERELSSKVQEYEDRIARLKNMQEDEKRRYIKGEQELCNKVSDL